jgi:hypothetical protein
MFQASCGVQRRGPVGMVLGVCSASNGHVRRTKACRRRRTASAALPLPAAPDAWRSAARMLAIDQEGPYIVHAR